MEADPAMLEALPMPRAKAELVARIPRARAALDAVISGLDDAVMTAPGAEGWSVKDHLLHISVWERMIIAHLRDRSDHVVLGLEQAAYAAMDNQEINDHIHARTRHLPLDQGMEEFRASRTAILALIDELSDEELARPYWGEDDATQRPTIEKIAGDTYRHDLEHRRWILEIVRR